MFCWLLFVCFSVCEYSAPAFYSGSVIERQRQSNGQSSPRGQNSTELFPSLSYCLLCPKFFLGLFPCVLCASLCLAAWQFTDNPAKRLALLKALLSTNRVLTERTQEVVRVTGAARKLVCNCDFLREGRASGLRHPAPWHRLGWGGLGPFAPYTWCGQLWQLEALLSTSL